MRIALSLLFAVLFLFPVAWMLGASIQPEGRALQDAMSLPEVIQWQNYGDALRQMGGYDQEDPWRGFSRIVWNTLLVTGLSIVFQLLTCSLAGFAFARMRFRGRDLLFVLVLATMMLPMQVTVIPQFVLFQKLGWIDTLLPLIVPTLLGGNPFFIFLFRQYFLTIPKDILEAARIDGCSWFGVYARIALPLSKPVLGAVTVFTFLGVWNDLWAPLIYLNSPENQTLTLALAGFSRAYRVEVEALMAASTVILIPGLVVYLLAQKYFIRGVQLSATKG